MRGARGLAARGEPPDRRFVLAVAAVARRGLRGGAVAGLRRGPAAAASGAAGAGHDS